MPVALMVVAVAEDEGGSGRALRLILKPSCGCGLLCAWIVVSWLAIEGSVCLVDEDEYELRVGW